LQVKPLQNMPNTISLPKKSNLPDMISESISLIERQLLISGMHYYMMSYLADRMDEHGDYKGRELKAHKSGSLIKYNRMLSVYFDYENVKKLQYSAPDLQKFIDRRKAIVLDSQL
jgi:hypothetical protein